MDKPGREKSTRNSKSAGGRVQEQAATYYICTPRSSKDSERPEPDSRTTRPREKTSAPARAKSGRWNRFSGIISQETADQMKKIIEEEFE